MNKVHEKLKLQHHRHTGKLLHHRHTSYRGLAVVLVLAASLMVGVSTLGHAAADTLLSIYGTAPVAIPSASAIIAVPAENATVTSAYLLVAGSCPLVTPQVVIAMEVDGIAAGSAMCDSNNDFSIPVTLTVGPHSLVARTYTIVGNAGVDSTPLHVTYQPPAAVLTSAASGTGPLVLSADTSFLYLGASRTVTWSGTVSSDHVLINWGDKSQDEHTIQPGMQHFTHHYGSLQSYNMTILLSDATGHTVREQYAVAAYTTAGSGGVGAGGTNIPITTGRNSSEASTTWGLYGLFLTTLSVCAIIWLEARHHARHENMARVVA